VTDNADGGLTMVAMDPVAERRMAAAEPKGRVVLDHVEILITATRPLRVPADAAHNMEGEHGPSMRAVPR
jgi:hypothetical protein